MIRVFTPMCVSEGNEEKFARAIKSAGGNNGKELSRYELHSAAIRRHKLYLKISLIRMARNDKSFYAHVRF